MILGLVLKFLPYIVSAFAVIGAILGIYFKGRKDANVSRDKKVYSFIVDQVKKGQNLKNDLDKKAKNIYDKVESLPDDKLPSELSHILSSSDPLNPSSK
jgi:hypothetical protein